MSKETGMTAFDIVTTLYAMGMFGMKEKKYVLKINRKSVDEYMAKTEKRRALRIKLDAECLRWTPVVSTQMLLDEERQAEAEVCQFPYYHPLLTITLLRLFLLHVTGKSSLIVQIQLKKRCDHNLLV